MGKRALLCKREELGLNIEHLTKEPGMAAHSCDPSVEAERKSGRFWELADQPA